MKYEEFRPTCFDQHIELDNRENWLVLPIGIDRDTQDAVTIANWEAVIARFGGEHELLEIHRFGHWGCGWFEIAILHPALCELYDDVCRALEDYPIYCEQTWCDVEQRQIEADWEFWCGEIHEAIVREMSDYPHIADMLDDTNIGEIMLNESLDKGIIYWQHTNEGTRIDVDTIVAYATNEERIIPFIKQCRKGLHNV